MIGEGIFAPFIQARGNGATLCVPPHHPCFSDHQVRSMPVLPGVSYLELVLNAAKLLFPHFTTSTLEDCLWLRPFLGNVPSPRLNIEFKPVGDERLAFAVGDQEHTYALGCLCAEPAKTDIPAQGKRIREQLGLHFSRYFNHQQVYAEFTGMGIDYGPFFKKISEVRIHEQQSLALLSRQVGAGFCFSNLLDCAFQSGMAISIGTERGSLMPFSLGTLVLHAPIDFSHRNEYWVTTQKNTEFRTDICVLSHDGRPLISVRDLGVKPSLL